MITATMPNDDDNNVETIEHVNYPKGLTSGLLNAINKFISNYNYQDVGKVRIITIRTLIKLVKLIINNNTKINIDDDDLTHEERMNSHVDNNITLLKQDKAIIESIYNNSCICNQSVLHIVTTGYIMRNEQINNY